MNTVTVNASRRYEVLTGAGLLAKTGELIKECVPGATKVLVVSDTNVVPLYMDKVRASVEAAGLSFFEYVFAAGEQSKTIDSIAGMWDVMAKEGFTRSDCVAGLGGGVVGDMAGFAAATFLRGIAIVQIPTSLLAQVDASVGGKTGIDLPKGKNLVGAFHQPSIVIEDTECLKTLSPERFTEGMAEVIKYAFIMDLPLYDILKNIADEGRSEDLQNDADKIEDIVCRCVADKAEVIEKDEKEGGLRQILNYGHTVGHVIERNSNFSLSHGVCVAKGMGIIHESMEAQGLLEHDEREKMDSLIEAFGLPTEDPITPQEALDGAMNDKKKRGDTITVITVSKIGKADIRKMSSEEYLNFIRK